MRLGTEELERVAGMFRVFGDATRLAILQELKQGELSVSALVECMPTTQANISKQLKSLHGAGVLGRRKVGAQVFYWIADPMVFELCALVCGKLNRDAERVIAQEKLQF